MMLSLRHLKPMVFILGLLVANLGMMVAFQVQQANAQGRIRQFTRTYTWSKPLWGATDVETKPCPYTKEMNWMANPPRPKCSNQNRHREVRYRFYDVYEITETYLDTGDDVYMIESSKEFLRREKRQESAYWGRCQSAQCPSHGYIASN